MLAAHPCAEEAPDLGGLFGRLEAATEELRVNATSGSVKIEVLLNRK